MIKQKKDSDDLQITHFKLPSEESKNLGKGQGLRDLRDTNKQTNVHIKGTPEGEESERGRELT